MRMVPPDDPILRERLNPYAYSTPTEIAEHAAPVVAALREAARESWEVFLGLAAPQIGERARVFVLRWPDVAWPNDPRRGVTASGKDDPRLGITAFINPELFERRPHEKERAEAPLHGPALIRYSKRFGGHGPGWAVCGEDCLSLPGVRMAVPRRTVVGVRYISDDGRKRYAVFDKLLAAAVQHEVDHLNGVLISTHPGARPVQEG